MLSGWEIARDGGDRCWTESMGDWGKMKLGDSSQFLGSPDEESGATFLCHVYTPLGSGFKYGSVRVPAGPLRTPE